MELKGKIIMDEEEYMLYQRFEQAAYLGDHNVIQDLIYLGKANPHYEEDKFVCVAARNGHFDVVKLLVEEYECDAGKAFAAACGSNQSQIYNYFLKRGVSKEAKTAAMLQCVEYNRMNTLNDIVEAGGDINEENGVLLLKALENGNFDIVKYLLEKDAEIHDHNRILEMTIYFGKVDLLKDLFKKGLQITSEDYIVLAEDLNFKVISEFLKMQWEIKENKVLLENTLKSEIKNNKLKI